MKKLLLAFALFAAPLQAQEGKLAADTSVARQLVEAWRRQPGDTLACLMGGVEDGVVVADSVRFAMACGGPGVVGMFGFIKGDDEDAQDAVIAAMAKVLAARADLLVVGEVHGMTPYNNGLSVAFAPLIWFAIRPPAPTTKA